MCITPLIFRPFVLLSLRVGMFFNGTTIMFCLLCFFTTCVCSCLLLSISSTFYEQLFCQYSCAKKLQNQTVTRENLLETISYKKGSHKMLTKLTPSLLSTCLSVVEHRVTNNCPLLLIISENSSDQSDHIN